MMKRLTFILLACIVLTGCSNSLPSWTKPRLPSIDIYSPSVIQGSVLDIKDINQLILGMPKSSVLKIIGSPSITDPFNQNQWDYINHSSDNGDINHYHLKLIFNNDLLSEIDKSGLEGLFGPT